MEDHAARIYREALGGFRTIEPFTFGNQYGYNVTVYKMHPMIISDLAEFMQALWHIMHETVDLEPYKYVAQDRSGSIYAFADVPFHGRNDYHWRGRSLPTTEKLMQCSFNPARAEKSKTLRGLRNPHWTSCVFPLDPMGVSVYGYIRNYIRGVRMAQINEDTEEATLGSPYSVSIRRFMENRLKLISKGEG